MKLLLCAACFDIRRIHRDGTTTCDCGASSAFHTDDVHVELQGEHARKVFVDNRDVANAIFLTPEGPARLYATFDWRTHPGWKGGAWLRADEVWEPGRTTGHSPPREVVHGSVEGPDRCPAGSSPIGSAGESFQSDLPTESSRP